MNTSMIYLPGFQFASPAFDSKSNRTTLSFSSEPKRKWVRRSIAATFIGALSLASPVAYAQGCTQSQIDGDFAMVCTSAFGNSKGLYVDKVGVAADIFNAHTCNGIFEAWAERPNGKMWRKRGHAKCGFGRVWVNFSAKTKFKDGAKLCGAIVTARGKVRPEHACIGIHK